MRGQGLKLSVFMCVHLCRGGGDSWQKLQQDSCSWKAVRITKQAAKTSSNKEQIIYIIKKRTWVDFGAAVSQQGNTECKGEHQAR